MRHFFGYIHSLLLVAAMAAPAVAQSEARVRHVPPAEAEPGRPLSLMASVQRGWESNLEIRFRPLGAGAWQGAEFTRQDATTYVAAIPGDVVAPPGLEYFIVTAGEDPVVQFASPDAPHRVNVFHSAADVRRLRHLERHNFRRAKIRVAGEWVDYGTRGFRDGTLDIPDRYYRIDADVGYRVLSFPLKTLRFGFTRLFGETPITPRGDDGFSCRPPASPDDCSQVVGFKGGGWFELGFVLRDDIELDTRGMVMATQTGFNVGGRAEVRIGDSEGTHLGVGVERIADVGSSGLVRLAWSTVPGFPMAATVEVTDFPASHRDTAVRLVYDVARPFANGLRVGARVGYQARDQLVGGITLGLNTSLEF